MQFEFYDRIEEILNRIRETQSGRIHEIAERLGSILISGGVIYVFGSGHSHILAEEISARAGGLCQIKGILEPELIEDLERGKSTLIERMPGYAEIILDVTQIRNKDALIIISNSGRNSVPVQMAAEAKKRGILTVALTNIEHSRSVESRDPSGKRLFEVADYVLDNCGVPGDAVLSIEGKPYKFSPTSTIAGAIILQALVAEIIEIMNENGWEAPVLMSANLDGNEEYNRQTTDNLISKFPELLYILK